MPPAVASASAYASNAALTTSVVLAAPAGAVSGDFLLAALSGSGAMTSGGVTPPAGWATYVAPAGTTGTGDNQYAIYTKVASAADIAGGTFTFTLGAAAVAAAACLDITGSNNTIRGNRHDPATGSVGNVTTTALAGVQGTDLTLMICWGGADAGSPFSITPPGSPWVPGANVPSSYPNGPSAHNLASAAAPGVQAGATWVQSGGAELLVYTLAVESAVAAGGGGGADRHHRRGGRR